MKVLFATLLLAVALIVPAYSQDTAAVDITGKWSFQVETGAGSGTPAIEFKQEGEKLTGHYSGQLGEADLKGTVKGSAINFSFSTNIQGLDLTVVYTGTIESKDAMKGSLSLSGLGDGTFTAKRNK